MIAISYRRERERSNFLYSSSIVSTHVKERKKERKKGKTKESKARINFFYIYTEKEEERRKRFEEKISIVPRYLRSSSVRSRVQVHPLAQFSFCLNHSRLIHEALLPLDARDEKVTVNIKTNIYRDCEIQTKTHTHTYIYRKRARDGKMEGMLESTFSNARQLSNIGIQLEKRATTLYKDVI